jgi:UDP-GlcNAc:undecaprenyl-phosphate/decaprenyl-phosphate GlcNAc-1-phosphate transferase
VQAALYLSGFLVSLVLSLVLTRGVRNFAIAHGYVSHPQTARHVHRQPIPRLGGLAIVVSVVAVAGMTMMLEAARGIPPTLSLKAWLGITVPAAAIFVLGFCDDLFGLSWYFKLSVQVAAALGLYLSGLRVNETSLLGGHPLPAPVCLLLTVFWVLLITNAFNLIDGLDGLAAGCALFSTIVIFICSLVLGNAPSALITIILGGAILGFLRFNFNPATIFLGDCGSLFIGFVLAALALVQSAKASTMIAVAIPVVSFGLPVLDVALAVTRRFLSGKPLFAADGEHIHHKLLKRGLSHRNAVLVLYGVSAIFALTSILMLHPIGKPLTLVFGILAIGLVIGLRQLRYHEFDELQRVARRVLKQKHIIINNLRIRRAAEALAAVGNFSDLATVLMEALGPIGFSGVRFHPAVELTINGETAPMVRARSGEMQFLWDVNHDLSACWEVKLPLICSKGTFWGTLSIPRPSNDAYLLMDLNLFTQVLQAAAADTVERLIRGTEQQHVKMGVKLDSSAAIKSGNQVIQSGGSQEPEYLNGSWN